MCYTVYRKWGNNKRITLLNFTLTTAWLRKLSAPPLRSCLPQVLLFISLSLGEEISVDNLRLFLFVAIKKFPLDKIKKIWYNIYRKKEKWYKWKNLLFVFSILNTFNKTTGFYRRSQGGSPTAKATRNSIIPHPSKFVKRNFQQICYLSFPKICAFWPLIFEKNYDIIYLQGEGNSKNLQKNFWKKVKKKAWQTRPLVI